MEEKTSLTGVDGNKGAKREYFTSGFTLGCTLTHVSMATTGNLWILPALLTKHIFFGGCFAFLVAWLVITFLMVVPCTMLELSAGRYKGYGVLQVYQYFSGQSSLWASIWLLVCLTLISVNFHGALAIMFQYFCYLFTNPLPTTIIESASIHVDLVANNWSILCLFVIILISCLIQAFNVKVMEYGCSILVIMAFLSIAIFTIACFSIGNFSGAASAWASSQWEGLADITVWGKALVFTVITRLGGCGLFIAFGTFMKADHSIAKFSFLTPLLSSIFCFLAVIGIGCMIPHSEINQIHEIASRINNMASLDKGNNSYGMEMATERGLMNNLTAQLNAYGQINYLEKFKKLHELRGEKENSIQEAQETSKEAAQWVVGDGYGPVITEVTNTESLAGRDALRVLLVSLPVWLSNHGFLGKSSFALLSI